MANSFGNRVNACGCTSASRAVLWPAVAWTILCAASCGHVALAAQPQKTEKKEPPPDPEDIELTTKDGVLLNATWYASTEGPDAAPLILLHGFRGSRGDFRDFALYLQREHDFAVIVPDLRGHGDSTIQTDRIGAKHELKPDRLRPEDFSLMQSQDVETVKRFLIERNNARELNIERLGLVGAGMGALVAAEWAYYDWEVDKLPTVKQGSDVKALTLISPEVSYKKLFLGRLAEPPICGQVSLQIVAGQEDPKALRNARHVYNLVRRCYADPPDDAPPEVIRQQKKLFLDVDHYRTSLQGTKMLGQQLGLEQRIARFFELKVVEPTIPWRERKSPL